MLDTQKKVFQKIYGHDFKLLTFFHEIRSLAERTYKDQGVDTKTLLGHRRQSQTDKYHDPRGTEWVALKV